MEFTIATRDRDLNASLNLASLAVSSTVSAWVVDSADTTTMKQEVNVKFAHE
jgi:putative transposase